MLVANPIEAFHEYDTRPLQTRSSRTTSDLTAWRITAEVVFQTQKFSRQLFLVVPENPLQFVTGQGFDMLRAYCAVASRVRESCEIMSIILANNYLLLSHTIFFDDFLCVLGTQSVIKHASRKNAFSSGSNSYSKQKGREVSIPNNSRGIVINVKTYYIARNIDVMKVHSSLYDTKYQQFDKKSVTITIDKELNQYISIFSYGSCVFFNIPTGKRTL